MIMIYSFPGSYYVFPGRFRFIRASFFVTVFTKTSSVIVTLGQPASGVSLCLLLFLEINSPPLPGLARLSEGVVHVVRRMILTRLLGGRARVI